MANDDMKYVQTVFSEDLRKNAISKWRTARTCSLVSFICFIVAGIVSKAGDNGIVGAAFVGFSAISFASMVALDLKIKIAMIVDHLNAK